MSRMFVYNFVSCLSFEEICVIEEIFHLRLNAKVFKNNCKRNRVMLDWRIRNDKILDAFV